MAFFKSKPNVTDAEKARLEFHLQQIAESIGPERLQLPVLTQDSLLSLSHSDQTPVQISHIVGQHLEHDVSELRIQTVPEQVEKCGGGG